MMTIPETTLAQRAEQAGHAIASQLIDALANAREGIKRLFPHATGITESERASRRAALNDRITALRAELARLGG